MLVPSPGKSIFFDHHISGASVLLSKGRVLVIFVCMAPWMFKLNGRAVFHMRGSTGLVFLRLIISFPSLVLFTLANTCHMSRRISFDLTVPLFTPLYSGVPWKHCFYLSLAPLLLFILNYSKQAFSPLCHQNSPC